MLSSKYIDPFSDKAKKLSQKFDDATINRDVSRLYSLINQANETAKSEDNASQAQIYYSIGTVYGDIASITSSLNDMHLRDCQVYYFRKSIALVELNELSNPQYAPYIIWLKLNLYTNYGNLLDQCGRKIAAIGQYRKVLVINEKFGMALGNLGVAYSHYGMLISNPSHRDYLHHFAYAFLNKVIGSDDPNTYQEARAYFMKVIDSYDSEYVKHVLLPPLDIPKYTYIN